MFYPYRDAKVYRADTIGQDGEAELNPSRFHPSEETIQNNLVPEDEPYYTHTYEGSDDMPAHLKSSLLGASVTIPISKGRLNLGTWQGLYLCEHRDGRHRRQLVLTLQGE